MTSPLSSYLRPRSWDELRLYGNSRAMKFTVFVPVLGYYILFGQWFNEAFTLTFESQFDLSRAYYLYYSFWALAVGSVMYTWRCPVEIAKFADRFEFAEKARGYASPLYVPRMQNGVRRYFYENSSRGQSWPPYDQAIEGVVTAGELKLKEAEDALQRINRTVDNFRGNDLYFNYYEYVRDRHALTRFVITYLYAGGAIVIAWTSLKVLVQVSLQLIGFPTHE